MHSIRYATILAALSCSLVCAQQPQPAPTAKDPVPAASPYLREASITQTEGTLHIAANSPRPLTQVLDALRQKYGWALEYEDPRYTSKLDLVERPGLNDVPLTVPAGGGFSVDAAVGSAATAPPAEDKTLQLIVDAYNQSKNPGRFGLRKNEGGGYSVVGIGAQDDKGKILVQEAPLDLPISLPEQPRTASETVQLICQKVAEQSHVPMAVGVTPRALMDHKEVKVGGVKTPARTLLAHTLESTGHPMYWRLLFDPKSKGYFLDVHAVRNK